MARPLRIEYENAVYHVTSRGNERKAIFLGAKDYEKLLFYIGLVAQRYKIIVHCYCLMNNHYHFLIQTLKPNLSRMMRDLNGHYTIYFNKRHKRNGHLFHGLFLQLNRLSLQVIDNCRLKADYEGMQYFLSASVWNEKELNTRRIELLQQDKRTRSNSKGALIIEDASSKKSGKKTEGCKVQYSARNKALTNCNVVVTCHYVGDKKDFAVNLLPYVPADEFETGKKDSKVSLQGQAGQKAGKGCPRKRRRLCRGSY